MAKWQGERSDATGGEGPPAGSSPPALALANAGDDLGRTTATGNDGPPLAGTPPLAPPVITADNVLSSAAPTPAMTQEHPPQAQDPNPGSSGGDGPPADVVPAPVSTTIPIITAPFLPTAGPPPVFFYCSR